MSASVVLANGPESCFVIEAVDALLRDDVAAARAALSEGAEANGWAAIVHRIDVVGRALAVDAGLRPDPTTPAVSGRPDPIVLLPGLDTSSWAIGDPAEAVDVINRWSGADRGDDAQGIDHVWSSLAVIAWLVERAGFPAEVVV